MIRKLEDLINNGFGVLGVYGEEGNYNIEGVFLWKGSNIQQEWN